MFSLEPANTVNMKLAICLLLLTAAQGIEAKCMYTRTRWQFPEGKLSTVFLINGISWTNNEGSNLVDFELKFVDEKGNEKPCRSFKAGEAKAVAGWIEATCTGKVDKNGNVVPVKGMAAIVIANKGGLKTCDEQNEVHLDGTVWCPKGYYARGFSCVEDEKKEEKTEKEEETEKIKCAAGYGIVNLNKDSAKLSTQYDKTSPPIKAVDAKKGGNWTTDNCACTRGSGADKQPWWSVEFVLPTWLSAVQIQNRVDCCSERLVNFKITLDGKLCRHYKGAFFKGRGTVACDEPVYGKLLKISLSSKGYLQLCDVVAIGGCAVDQDISVNEKSAALSTPYPNALAGYAVDNVPGGNWGTDKCASTSGSGSDKKPWWKVDFKEKRWMSAVEIQNRIDCCWDRLNDFKIMVDGKLCHHYKGKFPKARAKVMCDKPVFGKTLKINLSSPGYLQLCDVDPKFVVKQGDESRRGRGPPKKPAPIPVSMQSASLSSEYDPTKTAGGKAVDAKKGGDWRKGDCASTKGESWDKKPWWKVDFVEPVWLTAVEIQNRVDCCSNRLKDFTITLDGVVCASRKKPFPAKRDTITCTKPVFGRTLKIALADPGYLQLCDVQPIGGPGI